MKDLLTLQDMSDILKIPSWILRELAEKWWSDFLVPGDRGGKMYYVPGLPREVRELLSDYLSEAKRRDSWL